MPYKACSVVVQATPANGPNHVPPSDPAPVTRAQEMRLLWQVGQPWADFRPLLLGEATGPISFRTQSGTTYVVHGAERWYQRLNADPTNAFPTDGQRRQLLEVAVASSCGLRLRHHHDVGQFTTTSPITAVAVGEAVIVHVEPSPPISRTVESHPPQRCGTNRCLLEVRRRSASPISD
jgi:hypothetical protein